MHLIKPYENLWIIKFNYKKYKVKVCTFGSLPRSTFIKKSFHTFGFRNVLIYSSKLSIKTFLKCVSLL